MSTFNDINIQIRIPLPGDGRIALTVDAPDISRLRVVDRLAIADLIATVAGWLRPEEGA